MDNLNSEEMIKYFEEVHVRLTNLEKTTMTEEIAVISNLKDLNKYLERKIYALQEEIDKLEDKTIRLEKTFKFSCFYTAIIYVVFLIIGHWAHWI